MFGPPISRTHATTTNKPKKQKQQRLKLLTQVHAHISNQMPLEIPVVAKSDKQEHQRDGFWALKKISLTMTYSVY